MTKYVDLIGWDDCPHLQPPHISKEELDDFEKSLLPHQRKARRTGQPSLGAGAIYPVDDDDIIIPPFQLPEHWPKGYALDVGWNKTAVVWGAKDIDADNPIYYIIGEYYVGKKEPVVHASAIKARGEWMQGCIDPASAGSNQKDGTKLKTEYEDLGLDLVKADNAVEAGLHTVLNLMQTGRLFVFSTCKNWIKEKRLYRRDTDGKIVKENDHLMDVTRYLIRTESVMQTKPQAVARMGRYGDW